MYKENKPFISYLIFYYSFLVSVLICFAVLLLLNLKPGSVGNLDDVIPFWRSSFLPQMYKYVKYAIAVPAITISTVYLYFRFQKLNQQHKKLAQKLLPAMSVFSILSFPVAFIITVAVSIRYLDRYWYIFRLDPVIFSRGHLVLFTVGIIFLVLWYFNYARTQQVLPHILLKTYRLIPFLSIFLIILTLFDRTFSVQYLFIGKIVQYIHTVPLVASLHDVLSGKVLLVNADSQYGLLITYLPAILFKFIPLSFTNYFYFVIFLGIIYYIFAYILLRCRLNSHIWSLVGLIALFTFNFYPMFDRYTRPMVFPMRYLFDLPFFILLWKSDISKKNWAMLILPVYLMTAFYYNYETGSSLMITYSLFLLLKTITDDKISGFRHKLSHYIAKLVPVGFWILLFGLSYSLYALLKTNQFPDWPHALFYMNIFTRGYGASGDLPLIGFHLITITVYLVVLIKSVIYLLKGKRDRSLYWDIAFSVYGLTILLYFVKSTYILNLVTLSIPAIILGVNLFRELFNSTVRDRKESSNSLPALIFFIPFIVLGSILVFGISFYVSRLSMNTKHAYWRSEKERSESTKYYNDLILSASALNKYEKDQKQVVIFSYYDGFINLEANKVNALRLTNSQLILTISQVDDLLTQLKTISPGYIYADNDAVNVQFTDRFLRKALIPQVFEYIFQNYYKIDTIGILDVWQRNEYKDRVINIQ